MGLIGDRVGEEVGGDRGELIEWFFRDGKVVIEYKLGFLLLCLKELLFWRVGFF